MKIRLLLLGTAVSLVLAAPAFAADPMVGGAAMHANKNIVENAMNSKDHTTLVTAVKAGGLVDTFEGKGPFTVFAPTNEAFSALPAGTVDNLLKPENKKELDKILTYHVGPGRLKSEALDRDIKKGDGKAKLEDGSGRRADGHRQRKRLDGHG